MVLNLVITQIYYFSRTYEKKLRIFSYLLLSSYFIIHIGSSAAIKSEIGNKLFTYEYSKIHEYSKINLIMQWTLCIS